MALKTQVLVSMDRGTPHPLCAQSSGPLAPALAALLFIQFLLHVGPRHFRLLFGGLTYAFTRMLEYVWHI